MVFGSSRLAERSCTWRFIMADSSWISGSSCLAFPVTPSKWMSNWKPGGKGQWLFKFFSQSLKPYDWKIVQHSMKGNEKSWKIWVSWKQRPLRPPKTTKLENKDPPYFSGLRNYDQSVTNTTVSWALVTRILASWTDIRGTGFEKLCVLFQAGNLQVFNFHRK